MPPSIAILVDIIKSSWLALDIPSLDDCCQWSNGMVYLVKYLRQVSNDQRLKEVNRLIRLQEIVNCIDKLYILHSPVIEYDDLDDVSFTLLMPMEYEQRDLDRILPCAPYLTANSSLVLSSGGLPRGINSLDHRKDISYAPLSTLPQPTTDTCTGRNSLSDGIHKNRPKGNSSSDLLPVENGLHATEIEFQSQLEELTKARVTADQNEHQISESSTAIVASDKFLCIQESETNPHPNEIELFNAEEEGEEGVGQSRFKRYDIVVLLLA